MLFYTLLKLQQTWPLLAILPEKRRKLPRSNAMVVVCLFAFGAATDTAGCSQVHGVAQISNYKIKLIGDPLEMGGSLNANGS